MRYLTIVLLITSFKAWAAFAPGVVNHVANGSERTKGNSIKSKSACLDLHGQWFEEKGKYAYCILPYADAGKHCQNSSDCIGYCIAPVTSDPVDHGTCQIDDSKDDCGRPHYENGKVIYFNCD